jgi:hypothetical protein
MASPDYSALGPDPALEGVPDYAIILPPELLALYMAEKKDAQGNVTQIARTEEQVYEDLTKAWRVRQDAKIKKWLADKQQITDDFDTAAAQREAASTDKRLKVPKRPTGVGRSDKIPEIASPYVMNMIKKREEPIMAYLLPTVMQAYATSGIISEPKAEFVLDGGSVSLASTSAGKINNLPSNAALTWPQWQAALPNFALAIRQEGYDEGMCDAWMELSLVLPVKAKKYMDHPTFKNQEVICAWLCQHLRAFFTMIRAFNSNPDTAEIFDPAEVLPESLKVVYDDLMEKRQEAKL